MAKKSSFDLSASIAKLNDLRLEDLSNIDWENMGSWSIGAKIFFATLVFAAILLAGYFGLIADSIEELEAAQEQENVLKQQFSQKAHRVSNLAAYKEQLSEMEETFGTLLKQLPRDTEVPGLIDDISTSALGAGLNLKLLDPQRMQQTEFYKELPISMEVEGNYHEFGAFVSAVASLPRIVTLHDFAITRKGKGNNLNMRITAKTYQYSEEDQTSAKGAKK